MKYRVVWLPAAEKEFATIWRKSARRDELKSAALTLERILAEGGSDVGESRPHHIRITFEAPLGILFLVTEPDRTVTVGRVWEFR